LFRDFGVRSLDHNSELRSTSPLRLGRQLYSGLSLRSQIIPLSDWVGLGWLVVAMARYRRGRLPSSLRKIGGTATPRLRHWVQVDPVALTDLVVRFVGLDGTLPDCFRGGTPHPLHGSS